ncbi:hypothetical protein QAD02_017728 [Eretmocerus hayati]|uniref:Uncharacterized protein n=1 Tax=Eretmocerus hayati TaxID=131215 RepID=A0ACC2PEP1_9HYME|nr:hypothetical protein QAD02_017728 [Eretmocerus hayati]
MKYYEQHLLKIVKFMKRYEKLIECHLSDFFTENLWEKCLPVGLRLHIEECGSDVVHLIEHFDASNIDNSSDLSEFLLEASQLRLENCPNVMKRSEFSKVVNIEGNDSSKPLESKFMAIKKWHEVEMLTSTICWVSANQNSIIVDAGSGKGYLSLYLAMNHNLPVLAIEGSQINHKQAKVHGDLIRKKLNKSSSLIQYVSRKIDEDTKLQQLVKENFPDLCVSDNIVLTTLHGCGSLTDTILKSFVNVTEARCLCVVPCCYHLSSEPMTGYHSFTPNSRMLAQHVVERVKIKPTRYNLTSPSLFYRALLQIILHQAGMPEARIGRGAPLDNFLTYAKWGLTRVNLEIPSDDTLEEVYHEYRESEWKFNVFQSLRVQIAPVIEAAIILDKLLYLQQSNICTKLEVIQIFDPVVSPRSWAIVAVK